MSEFGPMARKGLVLRVCVCVCHSEENGYVIMAPNIAEMRPTSNYFVLVMQELRPTALPRSISSSLFVDAYERRWYYSIVLIGKLNV
jgi:hypothetical protein